jgi:hypothetical protein
VQDDSQRGVDAQRPGEMATRLLWCAARRAKFRRLRDFDPEQWVVFNW